MGHTSANGPRAVSVEVVTGSARLRALREQWIALWTRSSGVGLFESFEYCLDAWELVQRPSGAGLACMVGWRGDEMVAAWPFVTTRERLWTYARQLGASGVELHEFLVAEDVDAEQWTRRAIRTLRSHGRVDVVDVSFSSDSTSAPALASLPAHAVETSSAASVRVDLRQHLDWETYYGSLSKSYRKDLGKSRRRLAALGDLTIDVVEAGDVRLVPLVDWVLDQKRRWAEQTGKRGPWLYSTDYRDFLVHQLDAPGASARNVLLALQLDGAPVAVQIGALGPERFDAVMAAFDADRGRHSPGAQLNEAVLRWAREQRVDCDFGLGAEPYKTFWSQGRTRPITHCRMAVSRWGAAEFAARRAAQLPARLRAGRATGADRDGG